MALDPTPADTPLLLIAWRRPNTLRQVIDAIRPVAPTRLFVACDGPNPERPGEAEKVAATRAVVDNEIDWPCQIERLYSKTNYGCGLSVCRALSWFFEQVEEGIILEDDCVPHPDFFPYCTELLTRYRHDTRVWCISGDNFQNGRWRGDGSYYFSRYPHCWGWATWRRCWIKYDGDLRNWSSLKASGLLGSILENPQEAKYWSQIWDRLLREGRADNWDYRWMLTCLVNGGLTALPNCNLVSNVGFGQDASHTRNHTLQIPIDKGLEHLSHPSMALRDAAADSFTFSTVFDPTLKSKIYSKSIDLGRKLHHKLRQRLPHKLVTIKRPCSKPSLCSPYWIPRQNIQKALRSFQAMVRGEILDFGCGSMPYSQSFQHASSYIGLEYDRSLYNGQAANDGDIHFYDGKKIPFNANRFDAIVSFQVLEHVKNIKQTLLELKRVAKPGSIFLFTAPLLWPEHEAPHDYRRFTRWGFDLLCRECGLSVRHIQPLGTVYDVLAVFFLDYLYTHKSPLLRPLARLLALPLNLLALFLSSIDGWAKRHERFAYLDALVVCSIPD